MRDGAPSANPDAPSRYAVWAAANPDKVKSAKARYRERNRDSLRAKGRAYYVTTKDDRADYHRAYYQANRDRRKQQDAEYRSRNRENYKAWREANKDRIAEYRRQKAVEEPEKIAARRLKRRATESQATPRWANTAAIRAFYIEAARLTVVTGVAHEVDHIVPISGRLVCGLHCEANLQILTSIENRRKGNRFTPNQT